MKPQQIAEDAVRSFLANDMAARALGITVSHARLPIATQASDRDRERPEPDTEHR